MFRRRRGFIGLLLGGLLLFGFLGMAGRSSFSRGWSEGYFAGQQVGVESSGDGETAVSPQSQPQPSYRAPHFGRHYSPVGWFIGGIFKFWITLMLMGMFFKMFFSRRFRGGRRWQGGSDGHGGRRHGPPWCWHSNDNSDDEPHEKSPEDVEPDIA